MIYKAVACTNAGQSVSTTFASRLRVIPFTGTQNQLETCLENGFMCQQQRLSIVRAHGICPPHNTLVME